MREKEKRMNNIKVFFSLHSCTKFYRERKKCIYEIRYEVKWKTKQIACVCMWVVGENENESEKEIDLERVSE